MSKVYTSADQLVGKTPLLELVHIEKAEGLEAKVLGKLEYFRRQREGPYRQGYDRRCGAKGAAEGRLRHY